MRYYLSGEVRLFRPPLLLLWEQCMEYPSLTVLYVWDIWAVLVVYNGENVSRALSII